MSRGASTEPAQAQTQTQTQTTLVPSRTNPARTCSPRPGAMLAATSRPPEAYMLIRCSTCQ